MGYKIPHTERELRTAFKTIAPTLDDRMTDEVVAELETFTTNLMPSDKIEKNKKIASFQGVTVAELIASPNYSTFKEEYETMAIFELVAEMQKKLGIDNLEAWALVAVSQELI